MEFGSQVLDTVWAFYTAPDAAALAAQRAVLLARFAQLEAALDAHGPWFAGERFGLVDAVFAPVFRYFDTFEAVGEGGWFEATPRVRAWRAALALRPSVREATLPDYAQRLRTFLLARGSELSRRIAQGEAATA
jgi:glutathione S-transferase